MDPRSVGEGLKQGLLLGAALLALLLPPATRSPTAVADAGAVVRMLPGPVDFGAEAIYPPARAVHDWTLRSRDGSRGAHSEHTIAVTPDGPIVLTARA